MVWNAVLSGCLRWVSVAGVEGSDGGVSYVQQASLRQGDDPLSWFNSMIHIRDSLCAPALVTMEQCGS